MARKTVFAINAENIITALDAPPAVQEGLVAFATEKQFTKATAEWSISRLVDTWNAFAGAPPFGDLKPVKKFENRAKASARIWAAIQKLAVAKVAKPAKAAKPAGPREGTAKATVLAMIQRKGGATLDEIMKATGWQAHTCRGFISVVPKKAGLAVTSTRRESDKARVYAAQ
jgi:hypothetical protein